MIEKEKDFETTSTSLSKSNNSNDVADTPTSKDNDSVSQSDKNLNIENQVKDFYTFDERTKKEIEWLWKPYIVKGNINIIQGDGGLGKSYLTTWLLSAISNGAKIPFSDNYFKIGTSILQNAEDDPDATVLPRLILNGADVSKIGFFNEDNKTFNIKQINRLEAKLKELKPQVCLTSILRKYKYE